MKKRQGIQFTSHVISEDMYGPKIKISMAGDDKRKRIERLKRWIECVAWNPTGVIV